MNKDENYKPINEIGSCFDSSFINFISPIQEIEELDRLCHGIGVANSPGQEGLVMGHAWIEFNKNGKRMAYDSTWGQVFAAKAYREKMKLSYCIEYSLTEAIEMGGKTGYTGPWDEKIKRITDEIG